MNNVKKIIPYLFLLIIISGVLAPLNRVNAQIITPGSTTFGPKTPEQLAMEAAAKDAANNAQKDPTSFQDSIDSGCSLFPPNVPGCLLKVFYYTAFMIPSFALWFSAQFFNYMISIGIDSGLVSSSAFIPAAWAVVRDLSNMGFILILLYAAIETILGIGHGTKKMITQVVIIALLINFSMFFTKIVIDTSNILALVFYNTMNTDTKLANGQTRPNEQTTLNKSDKDLSGEMYQKFDVTKLMTPQTMQSLATQRVTQSDGSITETRDTSLPFGITVGVMLLSGAIMLYAAYTFFIAGISFLGRLLELWVLIIFSPFAFLSSIVPQLSSVEYLGWRSWLHRLISTSFMAPIFMFFMYLIFKLLQVWKPISSGSGAIATILLTVVPALIILGLLKRATEFAEKGGGEFGKMVMKYGKMAGGLAVGATAAAVTGGAALAGTSLVGGMASKVANNDGLRAQAASGNKGAQRKLALANNLANSSFDFRQLGVVKSFSKKAGLDLNTGMSSLGLTTKDFEGGRKKQIETKATKEQDIAKTYYLSENAALAQKKRAEQYNSDKEAAKKHVGKDNFNEADFKEAYELGDKTKLVDDYNFSRSRKLEGGTVSTVDELNADIKKTYIDSLDAKGKEQAKHAAKTFFSEFAKNMGTGMQKTVTSAGGLAATGTVGALTGGLGAGAVVLGGGFLYALKEAISIKSTNAEVITKLRKGVKDDKEEAIEHMQHLFGGGHAGHAEEHAEGGHDAGGHDNAGHGAADNGAAGGHDNAGHAPGGHA